jgi:hypothetical protein
MQNGLIEKWFHLMKDFSDPVDKVNGRYDAALNGLIKGCDQLDETRSPDAQESYLLDAIYMAISNAERLANERGEPTEFDEVPLRRVKGAKEMLGFDDFYNAWLAHTGEPDSIRVRAAAKEEWYGKLVEVFPRPVENSLDQPIFHDGGSDVPTFGETVPAPDPSKGYSEEQEDLDRLTSLRDVKSASLRAFFQRLLPDPNAVTLEGIRDLYREGLCAIVALIPRWQEKYLVCDIATICRLVGDDVQKVVSMHPSHARRKLDRLRRIRLAQETGNADDVLAAAQQVEDTEEAA